MANQLKMADIQAILSLDAQGWSHRSIAARLGVHRETVSRYVRLAAGSSKPANLHAGIGPECEPGDGSKPATWHAPPGTDKSNGGTIAAGEQLVRPKPANLHAGNSPPDGPSSSSWAAPSARRVSHCDPWRELIEANLRSASRRSAFTRIWQADWYEPELNPKLQAFAVHYGVAILPTRPRTPRHKGKVERGIGYVKGNSLKGRTFTSVAEQNEHLRHWENNVADCRIHGTTRRQVSLVFRELEQPALRPLPVERFPLFQEAQRTVHRDGHVAVERPYYSVPPEYLGRTVWVRWDGRLVRIFNQQMQQIAVHLQAPAGKFSTQAAHVAAEKTSGIERGTTWLLARARSIGPHAEAWAAAMLEARGVEGLRVLQGLLALAGKQGAQSVDEACEVAASYRAYRLRTVRALVKRQAPRQADFEFLASHPLIRELADYGAIARRAMDRTARAAHGGRNQQDPQVPSPESPTSFPSSLFH